VAQFGIELGILLGGAVAIFGLSGLGQQTTLSVNQRDLPVITSVVMVGAVFVVLRRFVVDMIYPNLDPGDRLQ
jgi:peptide/nickel transport system permease protein